jgi:hypothetical protein
MLSPYFRIYGSQDGAHAALEQVAPKYTLGVFTSEDGIVNALAAAKSALGSGDTEVLKNFLKPIGNTSKN